MPALNGWAPDEYRLSWTADSVVTAQFNVAFPTTNQGAAYTVAYWRVYNRCYATSTVLIMNDGDVFQTQMVDPTYGSAYNTNSTPFVLATCTQLICAIRPSTQYMVAVAGKNASQVWGSYSSFGFNSAGNPVGFKPQLTQR